MALPPLSHPRDLTDEQWALIGPFLPTLAHRKDRRGRPWKENRAVLNGVLWILRTGPRGRTSRTAIRRIKPATGDFSTGSAPACFGASSKFSRRRSRRRPSGSAGSVHRRQLRARQARRRCRGQDQARQGVEIMAVADRQGLPVAVYVESATPHDVTLVHATLAERFVSPLPKRLIGDNAFESDRLDAELARRGVELIAPHRRTRTHRTQTVARSVATDGGGRSSDSLPGSRTFVGSSCAMSAAPRTFSGCYTSPAV